MFTVWNCCVSCLALFFSLSEYKSLLNHIPEVLFYKTLDRYMDFYIEKVSFLYINPWTLMTHVKVQGTRRKEDPVTFVHELGIHFLM